MSKYSLNEWIVLGEVGVSSKTMWAAITGVAKDGNKFPLYDVPHDPDDFRRCKLFVEQCGITKKQLQKVSKVFKWWKPFIDAWDELNEMWDAEYTGKWCSMPKLFKRIQELEDESRIIDGWVKTSPCSWERQKEAAV